MRRLSDKKQAEYEILKVMNPNAKFCIPVGGILIGSKQEALERLMLRDWIRLIDVSFCPTAGSNDLMRIFRVMPCAVAWFRSVE